MKSVICAIAKNENLYINNWCKYHLDLGFSHIFLFDNNDSTTEDVKHFIDKDLLDKITIFNINNKHEVGLQNKSYTEFYKKNADKFDWCAFIDIDEFIELKNFTNVNDFFSQKQFRGIEAIRLQWHMYGDDDIIERDLSIPVNQFFKKQLTDPDKNKWCKTILRGGLKGIIFRSSHFATKNGKKLIQCLSDGEQIYFEKDTEICSNEDAWINHYVTKTLGEFLKQKYNRTDAQFKDKTLDLDYFWRINTKTKEKEEYIKKFLNK